MRLVIDHIRDGKIKRLIIAKSNPKQQYVMSEKGWGRGEYELTLSNASITE